MWKLPVIAHFVLNMSKISVDFQKELCCVSKTTNHPKCNIIYCEAFSFPFLIVMIWLHQFLSIMMWKLVWSYKLLSNYSFINGEAMSEARGQKSFNIRSWICHSIKNVPKHWRSKPKMSFITDENSKYLPNYAGYSCNKITTTQIQISRQNWNGFFSNISRQMMI